jgi:hypothetical protein
LSRGATIFQLAQTMPLVPINLPSKFAQQIPNCRRRRRRRRRRQYDNKQFHS